MPNHYRRFAEDIAQRIRERAAPWQKPPGEGAPAPPEGRLARRRQDDPGPKCRADRQAAVRARISIALQRLIDHTADLADIEWSASGGRAYTPWSADVQDRLVRLGIRQTCHGQPGCDPPPGPFPPAA